MSTANVQPCGRQEDHDDFGSPCFHTAGGAIRIDSPWLFESVIDPVPVEEFHRAYWGRRPLHISRRQPEFYQDLFNLAEVERHLSLCEFFNLHSISTPSRGYGAPDPPLASVSEVYDRLINGNSLRLRRMERFLSPTSPIMCLLRSMESDLRHNLESLSCYVAAPEGRGLGPHFDDTEIFTLQISGTKRWRLFQRVDSAESGILDAEQTGEAVDDFILEPGDLLYVPGGHVHDVTATRAPSFSLTIVFSPFRWSSVLDLLASRLAGAKEFVAAIPSGDLQAGPAAGSFRQEFSSRMRRVAEAIANLTPEDLRNDIAAKFVRKLTMPPYRHFENLFALEAITLDTRLEKRPGITCHVARKDNRVALTLPGGYVVEATARAEVAFREIVDGSGTIRVSDMHDSLSDGAKVALAKKLVACGLLSPIA